MIDRLYIYHLLPYPLKVLAASVRGYSLRRWRYGPETDDLVAAALERDAWSAQQWRSYQAEKLQGILERAYQQVPYYREHWSARRQRGDRSSHLVLENWPILEKETLRRGQRAFVAEDCNINRMFPDHTSGTTGKPLTIWQSRQTVQQWYALCEARWRLWYGVTRFDRWGILGGQLVVPVSQRRAPFWVWNAGLNQLYMSSYHLSPQWIPAYLDAIARYDLKYLWGYTSSLFAVARVAVELGRSLPLKAVITNAEPVFAYQRTVIERAFQCSLSETYGMSEAVAAASQCSRGGMHLWPEVGYLETVENERTLPAGSAGDLVCTGLLNPDMPLVRYRIGDRAALAEFDDVCGCGCGLSRILSLEGRSDDVFYTSDGRCIGRLDPVFKADLPIREAQIIQESLERVRVKLVPAHDYSPEAGESIASRLRDRMGNIDVILEQVENIPRTKSGKFRAVISQLSNEERQRIGVG